MEKIDRGLGWIERTLNLIKQYKIIDFIKAFVLILMTATMIGFISNPTWIFEQFKQWEEDEHKQKMEITMKNSQIINTELENLLWKTGADRCILLQYHNSKESLTGLPFIYLTATSEAINYDIQPVSDGYEAVKTSLYPFMSYLAQEEYWCGDIEELREIDKALAYRMQGNNANHVAFIHIEGEEPIGVLVCTYTNPVTVNHKCHEVEHLIRKSATKIGILLSNK